MKLFKFINNGIDKLKQLEIFEHLTYFSDAAASQYKNYKNINNLCYHKQDFNITAEWHFSQTSHGKSSCDGVVETINNFVARASHLTTVVYKVSIETYTTKLNLEERHDASSTIPGTKNHHSFINCHLPH